MSSRFAVLAAITLICTGCPDGDSITCTPECGRGTVCETKTGNCNQVERPIPDDARNPGRFIQTAFFSDTLYSIVVDPQTGQLRASEYETLDNPQTRVLHLFTTLPSSPPKIAASETTIVVMWRTDGAYEYAWRKNSNHAFWNYDKVVSADSYRATDDFDIRVNDSEIEVAYRDANKFLGYLKPDGDSWSLETIDDGAISACEKLAFDGGRHLSFSGNDNERVVAYFEPSCGDLRLARTDGSKWTPQIIDDGIGSSIDRVVGKFPSLVLNNDGTALVSYFDATLGQLLLAQERDASFEKTIVDNGAAIDNLSRDTRERVGAFSDLRVDAEGNPQVLYFNASTADLLFAAREGDAWTTRTVESTGIVGYRPSLMTRTRFGRVIAAERLVPGSDGLVSELFLTTEAE